MVSVTSVGESSRRIRVFIRDTNRMGTQLLADVLGRDRRFEVLPEARTLEEIGQLRPDVVRWVAEGLTNREIAAQLDLSEHTVKNYLFRIFEKLGISNRMELILYVVSQLAVSGNNRGVPAVPAEPREAFTPAGALAVAQ